MNDALKTILDHFNAINTIPRCSKNEHRICRWLREWAEKRHLHATADAAGNIAIQVPPSPGYEKAPTVIIQGHVDMVCEKTPVSTHDFSKDPIVSRQDGEWLAATDTTLGADNGIALAYAMALAEDIRLAHPPLELLFTVDEESGLAGVKQLDGGMISGRYLINLDSETEGVFTIGCAGGEDTILEMDLRRELIADDWRLVEIAVGGLRGGHSGVDIHRQRGNANKLLARTLAGVRQTTPIQLVEFMGGTRHNALAREARALVAVDSENTGALEQGIATMRQIFQQEFEANEPDLYISLEAGDTRDPGDHSDRFGLSLVETDRLHWLLLALPHGVIRMSPLVDRLVETSSNMAIVNIQKGKLRITSSQRSCEPSRLKEATASIHAVADLAGAKAWNENDYPPWTPDPDAALLKWTTEAYKRLYQTEPITRVIHAGLECAIIGDRFPGMEMISFGPNIENAHSPRERMQIPSVERVWQLLTTLLESIKGT